MMVLGNHSERLFRLFLFWRLKLSFRVLSGSFRPLQRPNLANALYSQGQYKEDEQMHRRTLELREKGCWY